MAGSPHVAPGTSGSRLTSRCPATCGGGAATSDSEAGGSWPGTSVWSPPQPPRRPRSARTPATTRGDGRRGALVRGSSDVDDWTGQRAGDAVERLHLRHDQLAQLVDVAGLGAHDHVVGAGDVLGQDDALDVGDPRGDLRGLADVGLDQDVSLDDHLDSLRTVSRVALRSDRTYPTQWAHDDAASLPA